MLKSVPLLSHWEPCLPLVAPSVVGEYVRIDRFSAEDVPLLWKALGDTCEKVNERLKFFFWLGEPPFDSSDDLGRVLQSIEEQDGWCVNVMRLLNGCDEDNVCGMASFVNPSPLHGTIEVGYVAHGLDMAQSPASTEAHYLLADHVFSLGYRRYEWKCDSRNTPSLETALRLGFQYEGTFRQHRILWDKTNRDTCWYSMLDSEWPQRRAEFESWLSSDNFHADGKQRKKLAEIRESMC